MNFRTATIKHLVLLLLFIPLTVTGQVKLPRLISEGMVLQRDSEVKIWGWASANEKVTINFIDSTYQAIADQAGSWQIVLPKLKAGGPYNMVIKARNTITLQDILIGDVWICSGQSNMELPMQRVKPLYEKEIASAENASIRYFSVPQKYNFKKAQVDFETGYWQKTDPEQVLNFSAVAYFFASELYQRYHIPIGLINASLGGSWAEAWISEKALKKFPEHYQEVQRFKDDELIKKIESQDNARISAWYRELSQKDKGYQSSKRWYDPSFNTSDWTSTEIPGYWADTELGPVNGVVWFRKEVKIPATGAGQSATLNLGAIVDADSVFVNGKCVGTTSYQYPPRRYNIPSDLLVAGMNIIVVRVVSERGRGGFVPDKPYELAVRDQVFDLRGQWQYRLGAVMEPLASQTFIRWKPTGLYNAMISPLTNYRIKGVIWYQGESNAGRPLEYYHLFQTLIPDWRNNWDQGDFPFLFVQLPNFMETTTQPSESNWALLRDMQRRTLALPNTGMAVTIDIGEWNDIHPLNKKEVGKRLALVARKVAYGEEVVYSGPEYQSMMIEDHKIRLTFKNAGSGLLAKGDGRLKYFAIAGSDEHFVWANAEIKDNWVIVWSDSVFNPIAVRYAWADNPEGANLYNLEGLPASPFTTEKIFLNDPICW